MSCAAGGNHGDGDDDDYQRKAARMRTRKNVLAMRRAMRAVAAATAAGWGSH